VAGRLIITTGVFPDHIKAVDAAEAELLDRFVQSLGG
jgi:hypothetical protein